MMDPIVDDYRRDIGMRFRPALEMCRTLLALKTNNEEYRKVLNKLTIDEFTNLPGNGSFGDGYSSEYELGYRRGLSIFLFPEAELERLEERKRAFVGGIPQRLPIGAPNQVLAVSSTGLPAYRTPGTAAWLNTNIPGGALQLDDRGEIPPALLPINSLTYRGTFGSSTSSTGGDLPTSGALDGDVYIADSNYSAAVAGKSFLTGQWAIFNGTAWDVIPLQESGGVPTGSVIAYAGHSVPQGYLPCNGYTLARVDYPYLFSAIGTLYNNGSEDNDHFSIPNYNGERRFLQGNTSAGNKTAPGLPELSGNLSNLWQGNTNPSTLALGVFKNTTFNNSDVNAGGYNYDSFNDIRMQASWHNAIYGASTTVQPPAQDVVFIIKYK